MHCRIRPVLEQDRRANDNSAVIRPRDQHELEVDIKGLPRSFEFDRVHGPGCSNNDVFDEVRPLVTSFIDGWVAAHGDGGDGRVVVA